MSENIWDVAVIGGGPAGCSAAIRLAEQGMKVVLFEAKTYPHDKMCGEFLSPECAGLLDALGVSQPVSRAGAVTIQTARLSAPDGTTWETHLPGDALGLSRKTLDAILAERAQALGVSVREGTPVTAIEGNLRDGFEVEAHQKTQEQRLRARVVIGAHGKRGALDRALKRSFLHNRQPYMALKAHFHGPPIPGRIELHGFPGGYCGFSEIEGGAVVVCLLVHERVFSRFRQPGGGAADAFAAWMQGQNSYLRAWLSQAERIHPRWISIAQVPFCAKKIVEQEVLMTGDSAGLIVPLAGNGISMALEGGMIAAHHAAAFLRREISAGELRSEYPRSWNRQFGGRLRLGRMLQPLMLRPAALGGMLRLLMLLPPLGQYLVKNTRGFPSQAVDKRNRRPGSHYKTKHVKKEI